MDPGEDNEASIIRELEEETGLNCDKNKLNSLGFIAPDGGSSASRIELFVATECQIKRPYSPNELGHGEMRFLKWIKLFLWPMILLLRTPPLSLLFIDIL